MCAGEKSDLHVLIAKFIHRLEETTRESGGPILTLLCKGCHEAGHGCPSPTC